MAGPCLCGDPYCASCGNPGAAAYEGELECVLEAIDALKPTAGELELAKRLAVEAIAAARASKLQELPEPVDPWEMDWGLLQRMTDLAADGIAARRKAGEHAGENGEMIWMHGEWVREARAYLARHPDAPKAKENA